MIKLILLIISLFALVINIGCSPAGVLASGGGATMVVAEGDRSLGAVVDDATIKLNLSAKFLQSESKLFLDVNKFRNYDQFFHAPITDKTYRFDVGYERQYNYDIIIADLIGTNITDINCKTHWALVLGSEAHGISDTFKEFKKVTINKIGNIESLNVSVASGILLDRLMNKEKV